MGASIVVQVPQDMLFTGDQVKALVRGSAVRLCNKTKAIEEDRGVVCSGGGGIEAVSSRDSGSSRDSKLVISVALRVKQK